MDTKLTLVLILSVLLVAVESRKAALGNQLLLRKSRQNAVCNYINTYTFDAVQASVTYTACTKRDDTGKLCLGNITLPSLCSRSTVASNACFTAGPNDSNVTWTVTFCPNNGSNTNFCILQLTTITVCRDPVCECTTSVVTRPTDSQPATGSDLPTDILPTNVQPTDIQPSDFPTGCPFNCTATMEHRIADFNNKIYTFFSCLKGDKSVCIHSIPLPNCTSTHVRCTDIIQKSFSQTWNVTICIQDSTTSGYCYRGSTIDICTEDQDGTSSTTDGASSSTDSSSTESSSTDSSSAESAAIILYPDVFTITLLCTALLHVLYINY